MFCLVCIYHSACLLCYLRISLAVLLRLVVRKNKKARKGNLKTVAVRIIGPKKL